MFHIWRVLSVLGTKNTACSSALVLVVHAGCRFSEKFLVTSNNCRLFDKQEESRKVKSDTEVILKLLKMLCELHYVA